MARAPRASVGCFVADADELLEGDPAGPFGVELITGKTGRPPLIAHVLNRLDVGGLETVVVELINATGGRALRHAVICLTEYTDFRYRIRVAGVPCYALGKRPGKDPSVYWRLWRLLRQLKPDLLQTYNIGTIDAAIPAFLAGVRTIVHAERGRSAEDPTGAQVRYNRLRRLLNPLTDHYIVVSDDLHQWLAEVVGVSRHKISRIYNGIDLSHYPLAKRPVDPLRKALPTAFTAGARTIFITVGRLDPVKDQAGLIRAFGQAVAREGRGGKRLRLVIVGDGAEGTALRTLTEEIGLAHQVLFAGKRDNVADLLMSADVFVCSSVAEGISNAILEAMACARPVIATEVGGNPELVVREQTGFLVPAGRPEALAEAMGRYVTEPQLVHCHGDAGRRRVAAHFRLDRMVDNYLQIYSELLCTRSAKSGVST